ncbi:hypothetical protein GGQ80_001006 [Sphingomonas jinjuensis]|uniref:DUF2971 domain-containing protein n=1 Tax=Sphingomonas jinjuensis TaxID=535907 RepID=A0A840FGK0_9SPHN|nr:DUF2971 domain-containing protein [Sphingomonas jinjuensis]MBB4153118.1 hypothetical protein [Sphingomonas jinjuensis]
MTGNPISFDNCARLLRGHRNRALAMLEVQGEKLAHYTAAGTAMDIISGKSLWLRNAALMNDFSEIEYGTKLLNACLNKYAERFSTVTAMIHPDVERLTLSWLRGLEDVLKSQTYISSLSVIKADEKLGRLSMWRAYGGLDGGVAIIFNLADLLAREDPYAAMLHPVRYGDHAFEQFFIDLLDTLAGFAGPLSAEPSRTVSLLYRLLQEAVLTAKHKGFEEEQEWRLIYSLFVDGADFGTIRKCVQGLPQVILPLPLERTNPKLGPLFNFADVFHGLVVGPCQYPTQCIEALVQELSDAGVGNAYDLITASDIPLRHAR